MIGKGKKRKDGINGVARELVGEVDESDYITQELLGRFCSCGSIVLEPLPCLV